MLWHGIHAIALGLCVSVELLGIGSHFTVRQCLSVPEHCDLLIRIIQMETFYYNSSVLAYFGSSSIVLQMRSVCSQAISVEPLPPNRSITTAFGALLFLIG